MALLLNNQAKQLLKEASQTGTVAGSQQWAGVALPLVRRIFGQIAAKQFVSVQPLTLPSGLVFYVNFKYGTDKKYPYTKAGAGSLREDGAEYWNDSIYGRTQGANSPVGGFYGAGRMSYSVNTQVVKVADVMGSGAGVTKASTTLADVNYDTRIKVTDYKTVSITLQNPIADMDRNAIRGAAFTYIDGTDEKQFKYIPQYTKISPDGTVIAFVVHKDDDTNIDTVNHVLNVHYMPTPSDFISRGDFEYTGQQIARGNPD